MPSHTAHQRCLRTLTPPPAAPGQVAEAVASQMLTINTNSRYLSPELNAYVADLVSIFPDPLKVGGARLPRPGVPSAPPPPHKVWSSRGQQKPVVCFAGGVPGDLGQRGQ